MKQTIVAKLAQLSRRLEEINQLLSAESATTDMGNYRKLTREHAEIAPVVKLYEAYRSGEADIATAQEMS
ncbi:MAG TPA: PCRF domain-containing protein, partial [Burkholderiales bacterium]|nr:PCRF domain-containing protein [Burkholderiales bacterium]